MRVKASLLACLLAGCSSLASGSFPTVPPASSDHSSPQVIVITATPILSTPEPLITPTLIPSPVLVASLVPPSDTPLPPAPTSSPIPTQRPVQVAEIAAGCERPPDDMIRVNVFSGVILNQRTIWMLEKAQALYGGSHNFMQAITQGSYTADESASFGTHDGGGAVDLSVRQIGSYNLILYDDLPAIILALRRAGFAAWVREYGELYANSPIHLHAIAVGDPELSEAAQRQLTGTEGYFRGFNGLPVAPPIPDKWGEPVLCDWMLQMGYSDLRGSG